MSSSLVLNRANPTGSQNQLLILESNGCLKLDFRIVGEACKWIRVLRFRLSSIAGRRTRQCNHPSGVHILKRQLPGTTNLAGHTPHNQMSSLLANPVALAHNQLPHFFQVDPMPLLNTYVQLLWRKSTELRFTHTLKMPDRIFQSARSRWAPRSLHLYPKRYHFGVRRTTNHSAKYQQSAESRRIAT